MSTKNIFYTSNSHSKLYPHNSRGQFKSQTDESEFKYLGEDSFSLAIKSITFENKFNSFNSKLGTPHMILVQGISYWSGKVLPHSWSSSKTFRYDLKT